MGRCGTTTGGGGGTLRRVGFGAKNGDCGARAAVTYAKYALLHALAKPHFYHPNPTASDFAPQNSQSPNSSSTILESFGCLLTFLAFPKVDSSPKILKSYIALESKDLSLRADNGGAAIHKNKAQKVDSMDCHAIATALARNDRKPSPHTLESKRHKLHTSTHSLHIFLESTFSNDTLFLSSRDFRKEVVAIHKSAKVDSSVKMDCHAIATALARNDRENNAASKKVDSRQTTQKSSRKRLTLESTFTPQIQLECEKLAQLLESIFSSQTDSPFLSSRALRQQGVAIHNKKVDSSKNYSASAEFMIATRIFNPLAMTRKTPQF